MSVSRISHRRFCFFFQAEDGIRDLTVTGVQTCALPISRRGARAAAGQEGSRDRASKKLLGAERMSTAAKVELVRSAQAEFRLTPALAAIGLPRATWYYRLDHPRPYEARHARLRGPLERIAVEHPEYGYRRTTTELRERLGGAVNPKIGRRPQQCWGLPLVRGTRAPPASGV